MQNIHKFEKDLKIKFKNKSLIIEALTHKSANQQINNEKLEFLGDRVLGLILSKKLFDLYPKLTEGVLDKKFASLVNRKTCCDIAWSIGIQNYIVIGNKKKKIILFLYCKMPNKTLKKMMKTTTKFLNKNRDTLCVICLLILVVLLVNELTGNIKEQFHELGSPDYLNCKKRRETAEPNTFKDEIVAFCLKAKNTTV